MNSVLYFLNSKNHWRIWTIKVEDKINWSEIIMSHGLENGKQAVSIIKVLSGKNKGKRNETSHFQQAVLEAQSKYNNKLRSGYQIDKEPKDTFEPMLAQSFDKKEKDIVYPCFIQPKLDGVRCIQKNGKLYSRKGTEFSEYLNSLLILNIPENIILDGEIYADSSIMPFETLVGLVKRNQNAPDPVLIQKLKYIIFDVYFKDEPDSPFEERLKWLNTNIPNCILTETVENKNELMTKYSNYLNENYEGIMIRNKLGRYQKNYRSPNLQKFKNMITEEFEIVGFKDGVGQDFEAIIWTCKTQNDKLFDVKPKGTIESRKKIYKIGNEFIGKFITVQFQGYLETGIPRFPIGISIRDYE